MADLSDFHEQLHNNFTKGTYIGFEVSGKGPQPLPGSSGYLAGYGPFTMTDSKEKNYEVFYRENSRDFTDKDKCISISLNWSSDGKNFIDPYGQSKNVFTLN